MNILFVVPYVPNLVRVRPYNLIRSLARRGHKLTLVTLWSHDDEQEGLKSLEASCEAIYGASQPTWRSLLNSLIALPTGQPLQAWYSWNPELARRIGTFRQEANNDNKFDVVHVEHLRGVKYGVYLNSLWNHNRELQNLQTPVVWDSVDCISHLFRQSSAYSKSGLHRLITQLELRRTELYEGRLTGQFSKVLITSQQDKDALISLAKPNAVGDKIVVIPNGVDLDYFGPDPAVTREENSIVVSGKMSYHANITMVMHLIEKIMPLIWNQCPDVRLYVVGKDPAKEIRAFSDHPNITVTGTVSDIRPYLQRAALAAAPLVYGAGIQNKVLESMACGTPVIATQRAVSAIQAEPGKDLMVAPNAEAFAENAIEMLTNRARRTAIGSAGREYVLRNHHWDRITEKLEGVYDALD